MESLPLLPFSQMATLCLFDSLYFFLDDRYFRLAFAVCLHGRRRLQLDAEASISRGPVIDSTVTGSN